MHQIDTSNAATSLPTPGAAGTPGYFTNGTIVDDDWLNAVQGELTNIVTTTGTALSKTNQAQVLPALITMLATPPVWLVGSGNVTAPSWATRAYIQAWGGGGGGGAAGGNSGAGGDGGGYCETVLAVTPGANYGWVGGAAGTGGSGAGGAGGSTTFGTTTLATGGGGGGAGNSGGVGVGAASPGTGTGTLLGIGGYAGQNGLQFGSGAAEGGAGGGTPFGASPTINPAAGGAVGGHFPGGGGSGAAVSANGGAGSTGAIKLRWLP